jgi:probable F420-dependent oxidoreductase
VKIGVALPQTGDSASPENVRTMAEGAERVGLSSLWVLDRLLRPRGETTMAASYTSVYSPLETLAYVAGITSAIRLGTSVLVAAFSSPAMLGKRIATVDQLSGGRLLVGLGRGYDPREFVASGTPLGNRGARFSEYVQVLRACWSADPVCFEGEYFTVPLSDIGPKPFSAQGPLLLAGARNEASAARAGSLGLGLNYVMGSDWKDAESVMDAHRRSVEGAGLDRTRTPSIVRANTLVGRSIDGRRPLEGEIGQIVGDLQRLAQRGVDEVFFDMHRHGLSMHEQLDALARLADAAQSISAA